MARERSRRGLPAYCNIGQTPVILAGTYSTGPEDFQCPYAKKPSGCVMCYKGKEPKECELVLSLLDQFITNASPALDHLRELGHEDHLSAHEND